MTEDQSIHSQESSLERTDLDDSVVTEETQTETIKKLREKITSLEAEKQEYLTGWQRAKADLINARKRDEEDKRAFAKRAAEDIVTELIPVLQSFESAMSNKDNWEKIDKNWRIGVESIAQQLKLALANHGLTEIDPLGKEFDPSRDEAIEHVPVNEKNRHNLIIEVLQKGYALHGTIIQAPRVKVGDMTR